MKKTMLLFSLLISLSAIAQQDSTVDRMINKLVNFYNNEAYTDLYNQLSAEFEQQLSEPNFRDFYKDKLQHPFGKIVLWKNLGIIDGKTKYKVDFERGKQLLNIALTKDQHIAYFVWRPIKDPLSIKTNNPRQTRMQHYIDSLALDYLSDGRNSSLSIAIINGDKTESLFYGETKKGNHTLPTEKSIYEIASISKTFTGIMLAHALNQNKISLQDDIRKYLPGNFLNLEYKGTPIQVAHLANHTSGLPRLPGNFGKQAGYDPLNPYKTYSKQDIYQALTDFKPDTIPGKRAEYSNFGSAVLGVILENVYQKPIDSLLAEIITGPLKMPDTRYSLDASPQHLRVSGYSGEHGEEVPFWDFLAFKAAGGLKSDVNDMLRYLKANMNAANPDISLSHEAKVKQSDNGKGLAWVIQPLKGENLIWHNGGSGGFSSFLGFIKSRKTGVIVLSNSNMGVDDLAIKILSYALTQKQQ